MMIQQETQALTEEMQMFDYWSRVYSPADRHIDSIRAAYDAFLQHYTLPRSDDMVVEDLSLDLGGDLVDLRIFYPEVMAEICGAWVFYIHGGGDVVGSADSHEYIARQLARDLGVKVFLLEYGLVPEFSWNQGLQHCIAAYQKIFIAADRWNIQADQVGIVADGSGCRIALELQQALFAQQFPVTALALLLPSFTPIADPLNSAIESLVYQVEDQQQVQQWFDLPLSATSLRTVPTLHHAVPPCFMATAEYDPCAESNAVLQHQLQQRSTCLELQQGDGIRASALPLLRDCSAAAGIYSAVQQFLTAQLSKSVSKNQDEQLVERNKI